MSDPFPEIDWTELEDELHERETVVEVPITVNGPAITFVLRYEGPHELHYNEAWWLVLDGLPKNVRRAAETLGNYIGLPKTT